MEIEDWYVSDPEYLRRLNVEVLPPVPFGDVVGWMSKALFNPVLMRPIFRQLQFVTPRLFETPAANMIPLFGFDLDHVKEIYGGSAADLVLSPDDLDAQILDVIERPDHYAEIVTGLRDELSVRHSHVARLRELVDIVEN